MIDRRIEQAILIGAKCTARSPGFDHDQVDTAERIAGQYGELPPGMTAIFVWPMGRAVGVWEVNGRQFHVLSLPSKLYRAIHDPFRTVEQCKRDSTDGIDLPTLTWTVGPTPARTLGDVQNVLKASDSAMLLGTAQALVDGGRVVFPRPGPDIETLQRIWMLLPDSVRGELTIATFAPGCSLGFDLLATPELSRPEFAGYLTEDQAGDYPEGRYELALQLAAETNDADTIDRLFARRSVSQALRLALTLLIAAIVLGLAVRFIPWERLR